MSYCRFAWGGSQAYIFATDVGGDHRIECCGCVMQSRSQFFTDYGALLRHIDEHRRAGYYIPQDVDDRIHAEIYSGELWIEVGELPGVRPMNPEQPPTPPAIAKIEELMKEAERLDP